MEKQAELGPSALLGAHIVRHFVRLLICPYILPGVHVMLHDAHTCHVT